MSDSTTRDTAADQRVPDASGKLPPFCLTCPDHEACSQGAPCWKVKEVNDAR